MGSKPHQRVLAALLACIALLGPFQPALAQAPLDVILVLDNSGSMQKNDPDFLTPIAVRGFIERLEGDARVGVLTFDQQVRWAMPLTALDASTEPEFLSSLESLDYKGLFTDSPAALERSIYELRVNGRASAEKAIIFLTDGIVDTGDKTRDIDKARWMREDLTAEAGVSGIRIYGIAFTDNADFTLIQALSRRTGGSYYRAYNAADVDEVFNRLIEDLATEATVPRPAPAPAPPPAPARFETTPPAPEPVTAEPDPVAEPEPEPAAAPLLPQLDPVTGTIVQPAATTEPVAEIPVTTGAPDDPLTPDPLPATDRRSAGTEADGPDAAAGAATAEAPAVALPQLPVQAPDAAAEPAVPLPEARPFEGPSVAALGEGAGPAQPGRSFSDRWPVPALALGGIGAAIIVLAAIALVVRRRSRAAQPEASPIPKAFLNDIGGATENPSYELTDQLTVVGRIAGQDADKIRYIVIDESTIGRRHALIEFKDHSFWVVDQNSLNGTFVNRRRIEGETRLKHGDRLRFHRHEFEFLVLDMFETDRTMLSETMFTNVPVEETEAPDEDATVARPGA